MNTKLSEDDIAQLLRNSGLGSYVLEASVQPSKDQTLPADSFKQQLYVPFYKLVHALEAQINDRGNISANPDTTAARQALVDAYTSTHDLQPGVLTNRFEGSVTDFIAQANEKLVVMAKKNRNEPLTDALLEILKSQYEAAILAAPAIEQGAVSNFCERQINYHAKMMESYELYTAISCKIPSTLQIPCAETGEPLLLGCLREAAMHAQENNITPTADYLQEQLPRLVAMHLRDKSQQAAQAQRQLENIFPREHVR